MEDYSSSMPVFIVKFTHSYFSSFISDDISAVMIFDKIYCKRAHVILLQYQQNSFKKVKVDIKNVYSKPYSSKIVILKLQLFHNNDQQPIIAFIKNPFLPYPVSGKIHEYSGEDDNSEILMEDMHNTSRYHQEHLLDILRTQ